MRWKEVEGVPCPYGLEVPFEAGAPVDDPRVGVEVGLPDGPEPSHRLVVLGDSLTHGVTSGAIARPDLCWSALLAGHLGWDHRVQEFEPLVHDPNGRLRPVRGGIPTNLEAIVRRINVAAGDDLDLLEVPTVLAAVRDHLAGVERYWERGDGSVPPPADGPVNHQLGVYSFDLRDALERDADWMRARIDETDVDGGWIPRVERDKDRAGERVLNSARDANGAAVPMVDAARLLGDDGGIGTLVVALGANNVLGSVTSLRLAWTVPPRHLDLEAKSAFTVWQPAHFLAEYAELVRRVRHIRARHVVLATVPHVTIAPVARGVGGKLRPDSRYFRYYARPWVDDDRFDPTDRHLTGQQARVIDAAVDAYNEAIVGHVRAAREEGLDWYVLDLCGVLDRLAHRRWSEGDSIPTPFVDRYPLPDGLEDLTTHFFDADAGRLRTGGLFSLDGIHPTTSGYSIIAHEVLEILRLAGEVPAGAPGLDHRAIRDEDSLVADPPSTSDLLGTLAVVADLAGLVNFLGDRRPS